MGMFDDLIPQGPQIPEPQGQTKGGGMFDDLVPQAPQPAPRAPMAAQAGVMDTANTPQQTGQQGAGLFSSLMTGYENVLSGAGQGTNPNVYHGDATDLRQRIGPVVEGDDGNPYALVDNQPMQLNPSKHVVLRDPASGELTAFHRDPNWDEGRLAGFSRIMSQGLLTGPVTGPQRAVGAAPMAAQAAQRANQIGQEAQAFERLGVRPFGPAFNEGPVASVAKQLSETPYIGAPLRQNLQQSIEGAGEAAGRVADRIAPAATFETTGGRLQQGLNRYRNAGVADVEPGQLTQLGINPNRQIPPQDIMSGGAAERAAQAAPVRQQIGATETQTTRGVSVPSAQTRTQTLTARTTAEELPDAALTAIIRAPSQATSFGAKSEALYERAWRMVPAMMREDASANPNLISARNTREALGQIDTQVASQISGQGTIGGMLAERIRNPRAANFTLSDLRAIRSEVGRALGNTNPLQQTLSRSQLKSLYAGISRDIEIGLEDLANRAALGTQRSNNAPNYVRPEVAREAAGALRAFRTADRYFRQGMRGVERFNKIVGTDNPTAAVKKLLDTAKNKGRGNLTTLRTARNALRNEEWADIQALMVRNMGEPVGSARGMTQDAGFSVQSFVTNWQNMEPQARQLLFGGENAQAINDLVTVANRLANVEALANTSRSGTNTLNVMGTVGALGSAAVGDLVTPVAIGGSGWAASLAMSRPQYTRWLTGYLQLRARVRTAAAGASEGQLVAHINRLAEMTRKNPDLIPLLRAVAEENGIAPPREDNQGQ
jgi:hypothetical protein